MIDGLADDDLLVFGGFILFLFNGGDESISPFLEEIVVYFNILTGIRKKDRLIHILISYVSFTFYLYFLMGDTGVR